MTSTLATVTKGQTFTVTQPGHQFDGRRMTVVALGTTGRTMKVEHDNGKSGFLFRDSTAVRVEN